jgi:heme/copper-type cytochrome/quinol oxidase subunit 4
MPRPPKRPLSVWIALLILALYISGFVYICFLMPVDMSVLEAPDLTDQIVGTIEAVALTLSLVVAFWAIATRREWGRWFVAVVIAYLTGLVAYESLFFPHPDPEENTSYLVGFGLFTSILSLVVISVSFGDHVNEYFRNRGR